MPWTHAEGLKGAIQEPRLYSHHLARSRLHGASGQAAYGSVHPNLHGRRVGRVSAAWAAGQAPSQPAAHAARLLRQRRPQRLGQRSCVNPRKQQYLGRAGWLGTQRTHLQQNLLAGGRHDHPACGTVAEVQPRSDVGERLGPRAGLAAAITRGEAGGVADAARCVQGGRLHRRACSGVYRPG